MPDVFLYTGEPSPNDVRLRGGAMAIATAGLLILTGFEPVVSVTSNQTVLPGTGQLIVTGIAPQVNQQINTGVGVLTLTGFPPAVSVSNNQTASPGVGSLLLTGIAPQANQQINTGTGQLSLSGFAPTVQLPITVSPDVGQLNINGFSPKVNQQINANVGALTVNGFSPIVTVGGSIVIIPDVGSLLLTGFSPVITVILHTGPVDPLEVYSDGYLHSICKHCLLVAVDGWIRFPCPPPIPTTAAPLPFVKERQGGRYNIPDSEKDRMERILQDDDEILLFIKIWLQCKE